MDNNHKQSILKPLLFLCPLNSVRTRGARPEGGEVTVAIGDKRYPAVTTPRGRECVHMHFCSLNTTEAGRGRVGQWSGSQLCCSGWASWLLWMFTVSSTLLWNTLTLLPSLNASTDVSEANRSGMAKKSHISCGLFAPVNVKVFLVIPHFILEHQHISRQSLIKKEHNWKSSVDHLEQLCHCFLHVLI